jgi:hypothetical protein
VILFFVAGRLSAASHFCCYVNCEASMAIQGQDYETIHRMLGSENFPSELVAEYDIRIRMLHVSGGGVCLGPVGCVDLCRSVGLASWSPRRESVAIDWREVKPGADLVVDDNGVMKIGQYRGQNAPGRINVKFDSEEWVAEYSSSVVRLAVTDDFLPKPETVPDDTPAIAKVFNTDRDCDPTLKILWSQVPSGTRVEAAVADEVVEYEYLGLAEEKGCLAVMCENKRRYVLDAADVFIKSPVEEALFEA